MQTNSSLPLQAVTAYTPYWYSPKPFPDLFSCLFMVHQSSEFGKWKGFLNLKVLWKYKATAVVLEIGQYYDQLLPSNQVSITVLCKCHFELKCKTLHWPLLALTSLVWALRRESPAPPGWISRPPGSVVTEHAV